MQMDFGLLTLAYCPLLLSPSFLCSIVSIAVPSLACQLPNCYLFTSLAFLSSFGRETSLVKITGPQSIFTSLFTPTIYFQLLLFLVHFISCVNTFVNDNAGGIDNSSVLVGRKVICCVQVHVKHRDTLCISLESYWRQTLVSLLREICHYLHQPSTWGNQRGELTTLHQENSWRRCLGFKELQVDESRQHPRQKANFWRRCRG